MATLFYAGGASLSRLLTAPDGGGSKKPTFAVFHPVGQLREHKSVPDKPFDDPHLALNRIYTKRGDTGETSLAGGQRVQKDSARIEAYGTVDELNAFVGLAVVSCEEMITRDPRIGLLLVMLRRVQHELFNLGSILATL